jgi:hypothetical protein
MGGFDPDCGPRHLAMPLNRRIAMTHVTEVKPNPSTCLSVDWAPFAQKLATALEKLEEDQFLILPVKRSRRYIQFSAQGAFGMRVETTSNSYLNKKEQLNEQQISFLIDVGWQAPTSTPSDSTPEKDPDGSPNYFVSFPAPVSFTEVVNLTVRTFAEVLRVPHPGRLKYFAFDENAGNFELPELGLKLENQKSKPAKEKDIPEQLLDTIRETTGVSDLDFDKDGDIGIRYRSAFPIIRLIENRSFVRIFSPILREVEESHQLFSKLNEINANPFEKLMRFFFNDSAIYAVVEILADPFVSEHIAQTLYHFSTLADSMGTLLQGELGGQTAFEAWLPSSLKH